MLRSVTFAFLCCAICTASRLDYPKALPHSTAEAFCKILGLRLQAPSKEYLKNILSKSARNTTHVSFHLPERHFLGALCPSLRTYSTNATIYSYKSFGSCEAQRYFSCGPLTRYKYVEKTPPAYGNYGIIQQVELNGSNPEDQDELVGDADDSLDGESEDEDAENPDGELTTTDGEDTTEPATTESQAAGTATEAAATTEPTTTESQVAETTTGGGTNTESTTRESKAEGDITTVEQEVTIEEVLSTTDPSAPDDGNNTDGAAWSDIRTATVALFPVNGLLLSVCLWAICCTEFLKSVRTTLHLHLCGLLLLGQLSLIISSSQCSSIVGAQLHFVFLASVTFAALEGVHLIQASFSDEAPSMSLFYIAIGYAFPLLFAAAGYAKLRDHYVQAEQLCILDLESGAGWLMLGPVIGMIVINVVAALVYECRISFLSENTGRFPKHLEARARLIRSLGITTFLLGLQWICGSAIQSDIGAFSVLFLILNLATSIAILVNHVACDRETRAGMARHLGSRGKFAQRFADILRPPPPKVNGMNERVTYHTPPRVSETLRSTLDRGIRPSIHLITPLDHIPVSR